MIIEPGYKVRLHFMIELEDGTIAESTFDDEPVEVVMGAGDFQEGLELALYGLQAGDKQTIKIDPLQGFGFHDAAAIHNLNRSDFAPDLTLQAGMIMSFTTPGGDEIPGAIVAVGDDKVEVDFNHPLAGHELTFTAHILEVSKPD